MARQLRILYPDACYHVTCRGNARQSIFAGDEDREQFVVFLKDAKQLHQVILHGYVLMGNHFHLLVQTPLANLAEFMRCLNIRYTAWYNRRHRRCGHLYQGRYHARLVDADAYLLEVSRYLHLNPARVSGFESAGSKRWQRLRSYQWSSLPGYLDKGRMERGMTYEPVLSMAGGRSAYRDFVLDGLRRNAGSPFLESSDRMVLGDEAFVERVRSEHVKSGSRSEQPAYRELTAVRLEPEQIVECVAETLSIDREELVSRSSDGVARGILGEMLQRYGGLTGQAVGDLLGGIHYSAVSRLRRRLRPRREKDKQTARLYADVESELDALLSNVKI
jgi:putative transposase